MVHSFSVSMGLWQLPGTRCASGAARAVLPAVLSFAALAAHAQPAAGASKPDPLDPKASVPALAYRSSFAQYRRLVDEKPISWREANDTVTRIGGWRVYAREAQQADPAPAAMPPETAKPLPAAHGGHKTP